MAAEKAPACLVRLFLAFASWLWSGGVEKKQASRWSAQWYIRVLADDKKARPQAGGEKEAGKAGGIMGEMRLGMAWMEPVLLPLAGMREARDRKPGRTRKMDWKDSF
ncbi:hypothetical protein M419DRAFT_32551 [Trichoderma reesei RUT C-30]|uniref:Uncharacterized protein n=1 Tax=Hypocrea jecorina (strain ATCC 56765 / BCRC 32924 / NRRL 11460 / Rut C-30) TaxID=1344414 RepID=A0A024SHC4_HYPJR|nr:hypothetical protein M419DRAFT_32551 [Trichoderma reesei RUT C-30]